MSQAEIDAELDDFEELDNSIQKYSYYTKASNQNKPERLTTIKEDQQQEHHEEDDDEEPGRTNTIISGDRHIYHSSCGRFLYHLAIIDYLQPFNLEKRAEARFKVWILRRPKYLTSAIDPDIYAERFCNFMKDEVLVSSIYNLGKNDDDDFEAWEEVEFAEDKNKEGRPDSFFELWE